MLRFIFIDPPKESPAELFNSSNTGGQIRADIEGKSRDLMQRNTNIPPPIRAQKGGSCPGESLPAALQNRVQLTIQECLRQ